MIESVNRRGFLKQAVGLLLAGSANQFSASSYARIIGANDRVRVGVVGFADRSKANLLPSFQKSARELNFELAAVSDIWNQRRSEGAAYLQKLTEASSIAQARNNDELYDRKDIDAVIIATADFQHALHGLEAVRSGRHAYIEKPLAQTMEDAIAILNAVKETGMVVQIGTQRRSSPSYVKANDYIRSGEFGEIYMVEMTWNVNQPGRWRRPILVDEIRKEDTDWKRYLMNRPVVEWDPRKYLEYRLFMPYSTGIPGQWMVHQIDTVHWFAGLNYPTSVVASGGVYQWPDGRTNPDTMTVVLEYGEKDKGFQVVFSSRMGNSAGGTRELYYSNAGMVNLETGEISSSGGLHDKEASAMQIKPHRLTDQKLSDIRLKSEPAFPAATDDTDLHMRNWMECIRSGNAPNADVTAGFNHSVTVCMTMEALNTGRRATFDAKEQRIVTA